jgi:hypothetical protein
MIRLELSDLTFTEHRTIFPLVIKGKGKGGMYLYLFTCLPNLGETPATITHEVGARHAETDRHMRSFRFPLPLIKTDSTVDLVLHLEHWHLPPEIHPIQLH